VIRAKVTQLRETLRTEAKNSSNPIYQSTKTIRQMPATNEAAILNLTKAKIDQPTYKLQKITNTPR